jgi:predicted membrane protein
MSFRDKRPQVIMGVHIGSRRDARSGLIWGGIIVIVGLALLLDHIGLVPLDRILRFWPLLIVCWGLGYLFTRSGRAWGVFLVLAGILFQLNTLGLAHIGFRVIWPLLIIGLGLLLMWGATKKPILLQGGSDDADSLNAVAIFGGAERRVSSPHFKGGRAVSVFGGVELDLRDAEIEGDQAVIEVECIFGGVEIRVPERWQVDTMSLPIFGGYSDKTRGATVQEPAQSTRKRLVITGSVIFGGVEIRN